jgi:hypothetical protein
METTHRHVGLTWLHALIRTITLLAILILTWQLNVMPLCASPTDEQEDAAVTGQCRTIALAMFQYANDHGGKYPDGSSSTEVFQKLVDGGYLTVPDAFYVSLPHKQRQDPGRRLRPENVSFDVTVGASLEDSPELPLVFLTGYKIDYNAGGKAASLTILYPQYHTEKQGSVTASAEFGPYLVVTYLSLEPKMLKLELPSGQPGYVSNFVPLDFDAHGKTYRQLTPEGVLK